MVKFGKKKTLKVSGFQRMDCKQLEEVIAVAILSLAWLVLAVFFVAFNLLDFHFARLKCNQKAQYI